MAFKVTLKIGTCSYHGWPWDIGSVDRHVLFVVHMVGKG
jgi:hypothetical protein